MRMWLLTNTTYGTWLPGDKRGSVTSVRDRRPGEASSASRDEHDAPGEPVEDEIPELRESAVRLLKAPPIWLTRPHADLLLEQFQETARHRGWTLRAAAVMANHFHLVVIVPGDPAPRKLLVDFKAYGSRKLNKRFGRPASDTWWTANGSKRKLRDEAALHAAIVYVTEKQPNPLVTWRADEPGEP